MLYEAVGDNNVTWNSACLKVPLVPSKYSDFVKNKEEVEPVEDEYEDPFAMFETDDDFGAKYLVFFSSRSLKTREKYISFAQFVYFLRGVCLLFNF